jgi:ubiquinone/menaquinone biosynthesis C-methylase UbiE
MFTADTRTPCVASSPPATSLRERWDAHAQEWIDWVRSPSRQDSYWRFHGERFLAMVPSPGRLTLDIGCGEGRVARDLSRRGHTVLGVDCSFTMCKAAANHPELSRVTLGDAARLPLPEASVDCAIAFMSLQDIDDMPETFKEIARVLEDGRKLALAIVHPIYSRGRFDETREDPESGFVIEQSYFEPGLCISTAKYENLTMTFHRNHRTLETYIQALINAGFGIQELREITDQDPSKPSHRVPMFLDILAVRQPRKETAEGVSGSEDVDHRPAIRPSITIRLPVVRTTTTQCRMLGQSTLQRDTRARRCFSVRRTHPLPFILCGVIFSGLILTAIACVA